jgi:hypothetical protein
VAVSQLLFSYVNKSYLCASFNCINNNTNSSESSIIVYDIANNVNILMNNIQNKLEIIESENIYWNNSPSSSSAPFKKIIAKTSSGGVITKYVLDSSSVKASFLNCHSNFNPNNIDNNSYYFLTPAITFSPINVVFFFCFE